MPQHCINNTVTNHPSCQLSILTDTPKLHFSYTTTLGSAPILALLYPNSKQDISEEYKHLLFSALSSPPSLTLTLSLHNNQLQLNASCVHLCCTFLSDLVPFILLLLYHHYLCSFHFTDIVLFNSYRYASHVPVFSILDIKGVSVLFLHALGSVSQTHYYY